MNSKSSRLSLDQIFDCVMLSGLVGQIVFRIFLFIVDEAMNKGATYSRSYNTSLSYLFAVFFIIVLLITIGIAKRRDAGYRDALTTAKILKWERNVATLAIYVLLFLLAIVADVVIWYLFQYVSELSYNYAIYTLADIPTTFLFLYSFWIFTWLFYLLMNTGAGNVVLAVITWVLELKILYDVFDIGVIFDSETSLTDSLAYDYMSFVTGSDIVMGIIDIESYTGSLITMFIFIITMLFWLVASLTLNQNLLLSGAKISNALKNSGIVTAVCMALSTFIPFIPGLVTKLLILIFHGVS